MLLKAKNKTNKCMTLVSIMAMFAQLQKFGCLMVI